MVSLQIKHSAILFVSAALHPPHVPGLALAARWGKAAVLMTRSCAGPHAEPISCRLNMCDLVQVHTYHQ